MSVKIIGGGDDPTGWATASIDPDSTKSCVWMVVDGAPHRVFTGEDLENLLRDTLRYMQEWADLSSDSAIDAHWKIRERIAATLGVKP